MPRPSVIPEIKERLEAWLDAREAEYQAQAENNRVPTLPHTPDFKINVSAVAAAIGLKDTQRKYLHERDELTSIIDLFATGQGLQPIGARTLDMADNVIKQRLMTQAKAAKADAQAATEARAREEALLEELQQVREANALLEEEVMRLKAELDMVYSGQIARVR